MSDPPTSPHEQARELFRVLQEAGHLPPLSDEQLECALEQLFDLEPLPGQAPRLPLEGAARILVAAWDCYKNGDRGVAIMESYYKNTPNWFSAFNRAARLAGEVPFLVWSQGWSRREHDLDGFVVRGPLVAEHADGDPDDGGEEFGIDPRNYLYTDPATDEERAAHEAQLRAHLARLKEEERIERVEGDGDFDEELLGHATFNLDDSNPHGLAHVVKAELAACGSPLRVYALGRYDETTCVFLVTTPAVVASLRALGQTIDDEDLEISWADGWWPGAEHSAFGDTW